MVYEKLKIQMIPAILWGKPSNKIYIHVHGKMSRKEYAETFAEIAEQAGYQTLSFDLPEHGDRANAPDLCDIWTAKRDLRIIADFVRDRWEHVSLYACSLGAYFALQTYANDVFEKCLFQSPIVDMEWLVEHMMLWFSVTEDELRLKQRIETPIDPLRWDYYCYIKEHPITNWDHPTSILYGALDQLQPTESIQSFSDRFGCQLLISPDSEHPFMEEKDINIVKNWIVASI